jgi:rhodanese-related sulfurtransferase
MSMRCLTLALATMACAVASPMAASAADVELATLQSLAQTIARNADRVTAATLNSWIVEDRRDFLLIDVRSPDAYRAAHIKGARNVPLPKLVNAEELTTLRQARAVVLYSNAGDHAAQAAILLRLAGVPAMSLQGGFDYWAEQTMNLSGASGGDRENLDAARQVAIIRALNACPRLPEATIPSLYPAPATPAPAPSPPSPPRVSPPAKQPDGPVIIDGACG